MNIKTLIDEKEIQDRIKIVADKIQKDYDNEEIVIVNVLYVFNRRKTHQRSNVEVNSDKHRREKQSESDLFKI